MLKLEALPPRELFGFQQIFQHPVRKIVFAKAPRWLLRTSVIERAAQSRLVAHLSLKNGKTLALALPPLKGPYSLLQRGGARFARAMRTQ